jgi:hypothetical protein
MANGKIEQAKNLREQADQLLVEVKEEEKKKIDVLREELKKAEKVFKETYGTAAKPRKGSKAKGSGGVKPSSNPLMDEEIIRIYENGLKKGITDIKTLKTFLDPQLKRRITILNEVVEAWEHATRDVKSNPEKFVDFFKASPK